MELPVYVKYNKLRGVVGALRSMQEQIFKQATCKESLYASCGMRALLCWLCTMSD